MSRKPVSSPNVGKLGKERLSQPRIFANPGWEGWQNGVSGSPKQGMGNKMTTNEPGTAHAEQPTRETCVPTAHREEVYEEGSGINLQQSTKLSHIPRTLCEIHDHDTHKICACKHKNDCTEAETDAGPAGLATDTEPKADYRESLDGIITNHS